MVLEKYHAKVKKPDLQSHILLCSVYMEDQKQKNREGEQLSGH